MFKDFEYYTTFQKILLSMFFVVCFVLSILLMIDFFLYEKSIIDISIAGFALITGFLIIVNSRWSTVTRLVYLSLYIVSAIYFKAYIEASIKLFWLLPLALYDCIRVFPIKTDLEWTKYLRKMKLRRYRTISPKVYYAWVITLLIFATILYNFLEDLHLNTGDESLTITFYVFLTLSGLVFGYLTKNQSLAKWPYGLIYHFLVFYMWSNLEESFAIDIYCLFWLIYSILGCIEGFYVQEKGLKKSIFLLELSTMRDVRKRRIRKNTKY